MTTAPYKPDKEMILTPLRWPCWPMLPLVQRGTGSRSNLGFITPDYPNIVIKATIFSVNPTAIVRTQLENDGEVPGIETIVYSDVDAMLDDNWRVD